MSNSRALSNREALGMILVPSLISLAVTILRLTGELRHWSERWFSTDTGGTTPHGVSWFFGITWLAAPFGIYFAIRLTRAGQGPRSVARALTFAALGLIILIGFRFPIAAMHLGFPHVLLLVWLSMAVAGFLQFYAWPALFRLLLFYGLAARIPVVIIMLFAMFFNWGTHYDYVGMPPQFSMPLVPRFLWLAFFPQLIFWVAFTIVVGSISGTLVTALIRFRPPAERIDIGC